MLHTYFLGILLVVGSGYAFYDSSDVIELTPDNFDQVTKSDAVWLVEFYAPWCGHCKKLVPEFKKTATALRGIVKVGALDADKYKSFGKQFGVSGFPTIKIFTDGNHVPYKGARTAEAFVLACLQELKNKAYGRLGKRPDADSDKLPAPSLYGHDIPWKQVEKNTSEKPPPPGANQQLNDTVATSLPHTLYLITKIVLPTEKIYTVTTEKTTPGTTTRKTLLNQLKFVQEQFNKGNLNSKQKAKLVRVLMRLKTAIQYGVVMDENAPLIKRAKPLNKQGGNKLAAKYAAKLFTHA